MILVIGAGLAGLACARTLVDAGRHVVVLEKSRGLGGRLATRRSDHGSFDHGAQYVTARDPAFRAYLDRARQAGAAETWSAVDGEAFVGTPGMSRLVRPLAEGLDIRTATRVTRVTRHEGAWQVETENGASLDAATLLVTAPWPQMLDLVGSELPSAIAEAPVRLAPCWTVLLAFDRELPVGPDALKDRIDTLSWMARDSSKPGRAAVENWVLQASPDWSASTLDWAPELIIEKLTEAFAEQTGIDVPQPVHAQAHRWRYARVMQPLGRSCVWLEDVSLGLAGDWCLDARAEAAFMSGRALGQAVLHRG